MDEGTGLAFEIPLDYLQVKLLEFLQSPLFLQFGRPDPDAAPHEKILACSLRLLDHAKLSTKLQTPSKEHLVLQLCSVVVDGERLCVLVRLEDCTPLLESGFGKNRRGPHPE